MQRLLSATTIAIVIAAAFPFGQQNDPAIPLSPAVATPRAPEADETPHSWLVQLASPPTADGSTEQAIAAEEGRFHAQARSAGVRYQESRHFRHLWNGVAVDTDSAGAEIIRSLPGVQAVYPVVSATRSQQEAGGTNEADMMTALAMTGADIAQDVLGLSGRGVRVAVIDSGIDYDHPDLGGCFGHGCRVARGWDFVGDAYNPDPTSAAYNPVPLPDPLPDDCDGHGTHVSGIIAANGTIRGVAPNVTLHAYRVFGCVGPTSTDIILAAMEQAYADGADILNLSLGAPYQWPTYPTAQAADRLVKRGMVVVSSAGNEGAKGLYATAAPGIGARTLGVASFDNTFSNVAHFTVSPDNRAVGYLPASGSVSIPLAGSAPLVRTGLPTATADACSPLPAGALRGRIALIRRGTCGFVIKAAVAQAAGAIGVVIYNSAPERITISVTGGPPILIPVVSISGTEGTLLSHRLASGPVTLSWTSGAVQEPLPTANLISAFSSYGPAADLTLKPDLGAPGGAIRSTVPLEKGAFGTISGTSMAAPYVTGAIALMREAHPGLSPGEITRRLQNTAIPHRLAAAPTSGALEMVHRQGAGLITVDAAIETDMVVSPSRLSLGEFEDGRAKFGRLRLRSATPPAWDRGTRSDAQPHKFGRRGRKADPVVYRLGHEPATATGASTFFPTPILSFATVTFSAPTTKGGQDVVVRIEPPSDPAVRLFGGYITLTPDHGGPALRVPYLGYRGDYQEIQALTPTAADLPWLAKVVGTGLARQPDGATYTLSGLDVPFVLFHLDHQVRRLQIEVIDAATGRSRGFASMQDFVGRNSSPSAFFSFAWNGTVTRQGTTTSRPVPNGAYRLKLSVVKALGLKKYPGHVEEWTTPTVVIARTNPA